MFKHRQRLIRFRTFAAVAAVAGLALSLTGVPAGAAPAAPAPGTCWGDYCSGKNPSTTKGPNGQYCSSSAYTTASRSMPGDSRWRIELRWSPSCKTNWARWVGPASPRALTALQNTGYRQTRILGGGGSWYTPMIYSPGKAVKATGCHTTAGCISTAWA